MRFWPILYHLNLVGGHGETLRGKDVTKVLGAVRMELTLFRLGVEAVLPESPENLLNVLAMVGNVIGEYGDVIQIDNDTDVEEITEDVVHETLEGRRGVGQPERHNQPFEGAVASAECGLPFISIGDADKMISMAKINLGIDSGTARSVQEIRNERERIAILAGDAIETSEVHAKTEGAVLFANKEDRSAVGRRGGTDETSAEILVDELLKRLHFRMGNGIDAARRDCRPRLEIDGEIVGPVFRETISPFLGEDIRKFVIFLRNGGEIRAGVGGRRCRPGLNSGVQGVKRNLKLGRTRKSSRTLESSRTDKGNGNGRSRSRL